MPSARQDVADNPMSEMHHPSRAMWSWKLPAYQLEDLRPDCSDMLKHINTARITYLPGLRTGWCSRLKELFCGVVRAIPESMRFPLIPFPVKDIAVKEAGVGPFTRPSARSPYANASFHGTAMVSIIELRIRFHMSSDDVLIVVSPCSFLCLLLQQCCN